jgi:alpha-2-macroglobulin
MKKILSSLLAISILLSCGGSVQSELSNSQVFSSYISGYTAGLVSRRSTIKLKLTESLGEDFDLTKRFDKNVFSFSPSIEGETRWIDNRTIEFLPTNKLEQGTDYTVNFHLKELKNVPKELETFVFKFRTLTQSFEVTRYGLTTPSQSNRGIQQLEGIISLADVVDSGLIDKVFSAVQNGKILPSEISTLGNNEFRFVIGNIARDKTKDSELTIKVKGSPIGVEKDYEDKVTVNSQQSFKITETIVIQSPQQFVRIHFSDPLEANQNLNGLITIDNRSVQEYVIEGHEIKVYPSSQMNGTSELVVFKGVKNFEGLKLKYNYSKEIEFKAQKPDVKEYGDGVIIPSEGKMNFPFEAVNLKAVDIILTKIYESNLLQFFQVNNLNGEEQLQRVGEKVLTKKLDLTKTGVDLTKWNKFFIDLSSVIDENDGAIYQIHIRFKKEYSNYNCDNEENKDGLEELEYVSTETDWNENDWRTYDYDYYDDYEYYEYNYDYSERNNPCHSMYYRGKGITKNIILSNIGIIAKAGPDKVLHVVVNNINTTQPYSGVDLAIYNYQQQLIASVSTDAEGMASIQLDEKPFVIIASLGKQRGYIKLRDAESLSLSKFDVSGATIQKGIKGFIYGERGVWRPGDSIYLTFMLEDKNQLLPQNHPVEFTLHNPKNQLITRKVSSSSVNGLYDFRTITNQEAITGNYRVQIKVGNRQFVKYIKVETVMPNRLKVYLETDKKYISMKDRMEIDLSAMWLHGSPANKLKAKVDVSIDQQGTNFVGYKGFEFDDPLKRYYSNDFTVFDSRLDAEGKAKFPLKLSVPTAAPGMLNAHFTTKVFEEGGGFSINRKLISYSPYTSYIGVKVPKGDLYAGTLEVDKTHKIEFATVTEDGKSISNAISIKIYKVEWRYWWDRYDNDLSSYISRSSVSPIVSKELFTKEGKTSINFKTTKWGRYLVIAKDKNSGHSTGKVFYADQRYWSRSNDTDKEFASMLAFATDKESYEVGEEVKFSFPSKSGGRALVSIENGSKIIEKKWIKTDDKETKGSFKVSEEMTPNVFVHITMLQPHKNTLESIPLRMYGIVPISIENKNSHLEPVIEMPSVLRPETTATIKVKEKSGKRMSYTLAIVDEGLLDLTGFQTPDPWNTFYAREALGVKTWDIYDYVLNAFKLEQNKILAVGGGGEINGDKKPAKANRFEPMVRFIGPFELPNGTKSHKIKIPNYVGSVRVMVVAGEDLKYGSAEKTVPVRNPLMVLGTLPRVVGPNEDITLPVDVFAMEKQIKNVSIKVTANDFFELEEDSKNLTFEKTGDEVIRFKMKTSNKLGIGKVSIVATSGKEKATYDFEIDVRPANPMVTNVKEAIVEAGSSWESSYAFNGIDGTNEVAIEVSSIPAINLEKRLDYLIQYPHGCIEQTTSSVFPQLYLSTFTKLNSTSKIEIERNIKEAIFRLQNFQTSNGGFAYWPGESSDNPWGTNYATHFLIEAEKQGYTLPYGMKNKLTKYLKNEASSWRANKNESYYYRYQSNEIMQAYRLYVLALANKGELGAMNRMKESKNLSINAKWRLAAAYKLMGQDKVARSLIFGIPTDIDEYKEFSYSYGSSTRDEAMILEVLSLMDEKAKAGLMAKKVATQLGNSDTWMSTQTTAYSLIAMSKFLDGAKTSGIMKFSYSLDGKIKSTSSNNPIFIDRVKPNSLKEGKVSLNNTGNGLVYVRVTTKGIPIESNELDKDNNLKMNVTYLDMNGKSINPASISQGTDFKMQVTVFNPGLKGDIQEMALSQIFPSGWEIHNGRMSNYNSGGNSYFDYQDVRDDRVYTYFSLSKGKSKTFTVNLNATYDGKYYLPSILCQAMYDNSLSSVKPGKWVEVVRN